MRPVIDQITGRPFREYQQNNDVAREGFEPPSTEYESVMLPLHHLAIKTPLVVLFGDLSTTYEDHLTVNARSLMLLFSKR